MDDKPPVVAAAPSPASRVGGALGGAFGAGLVLVVLPSLALIWKLKWFAENPAVGLPIVAVFGIMILFGALSLVSTLFARLELDNKAEALALPAGSIRAFIALALIDLMRLTERFKKHHRDQREEHDQRQRDKGANRPCGQRQRLSLVVKLQPREQRRDECQGAQQDHDAEHCNDREPDRRIFREPPEFPDQRQARQDDQDKPRAKCATHNTANPARGRRRSSLLKFVVHTMFPLDNCRSKKHVPRHSGLEVCKAV